VTLTFNRPATDTLVVVAEGTLDDRNVGPLLAEGYKTIDEGATRVVIDCSKLRYISSFGLGAMVRLHKRLADRGHRLTLAAVSPHLATQLRLVRLSDVFARAPSVDAVLEQPPARS
jgi:anti-sigma B factor antagonist